MIKGFRDLIVYQRAYERSLKIHQITLKFPAIEQYVLGDQIRRATKSVAMNIAEGFGKKSTLAEFKRFLTMALGSCEEIRVQLDYCKDLGYIDAGCHNEYEQAYVETGKMLVSMIKNWKQFE